MATNRTTVLLLCAAVGCGRREPPGQTSPGRWQIGATPIRVIADSILPSGIELTRISDARLLPDGRLIVANSGANQLLVFDPSGTLIRRVGRRGQGPGDFADALFLFLGTGDSLVVADAANLRWSVWDRDLAGSRIALFADSPYPRPGWLRRGALITEATLADPPVWIAEVIDTLRASDPAYTRLIAARRDDLGVLWVRDPSDSTTWTTYGGPRSPIGTVLLPSGFRPTQIGADFVVGVTRDSLDVERVEIRTLERPTASIQSGPTLGSTRSQADSTVYRQLVDIMMAQERFYADHARYSLQADSLMVKLHPGLAVLGVEADKFHWAALVVDRGSGATCGVWVGGRPPPGWLDGTTVCGR
jgi:hypothetical protein